MDRRTLRESLARAEKALRESEAEHLMKYNQALQAAVSASDETRLAAEAQEDLQAKLDEALADLKEADAKV